MRRLAPLALVAAALSVGPTRFVALAQEACPDLADDRSVLVGSVQDPQLPGLPMPGAVVSVWWEIDGERDSEESTVAEDGQYVVCGVPRGVALFAQATFGGREGTVEELEVADPTARLDLTISLSGGEDESRQRAFPIVMDGSGRCPELLAPSVARCVDFTDCGTVRLGTVRARRVGEGGGTRATVEELVEQARRLDAHAVEGLRAYWQEDASRPVLTRLEGTAVGFTDERCRRLAGVTG